MVDQKISVPKYWRRIAQYYRLEAVKCRNCGKIYYPPRIRCICGSRSFEKIELPKNGRLIQYTILHQVGISFEKIKPIAIGLVEFDNINVKVIGQITDCLDYTRLTPGIEVEVVLRKIKHDDYYGLIVYGYKFRPVKIEWC